MAQFKDDGMKIEMCVEFCRGNEATYALISVRNKSEPSSQVDDDLTHVAIICREINAFARRTSPTGAAFRRPTVMESAVETRLKIAEEVTTTPPTKSVRAQPMPI